MRKNKVYAVTTAIIIGVAVAAWDGLYIYADEAVQDASEEPQSEELQPEQSEPEQPQSELPELPAPPPEMVVSDGNVYYYYPDGTMARDWVMIGLDWFFFRPSDGTMAFNTVINGYQFDVFGRFVGMVEPEAEPEPEPEIPVKNRELKDKVDSILASIITEGMSEDQKIRACYNYVMDSTVYKRTYETPAGDWTGDFALQLLTSGRGNCYRYSAAFAYLVTGLGYEAKVSTGQVAARRGGTTPHGWAEVKVDGVWYIYDPDIEDGNRSYDCYKKTYANYPIKPLIRNNEWPVSF